METTRRGPWATYGVGFPETVPFDELGCVVSLTEVEATPGAASAQRCLRTGSPGDLELCRYREIRRLLEDIVGRLWLSRMKMVT